MNLHQVKNDVVDICAVVGEFIRREAENFDLQKIEQKTAFNNLVSYVDKEAERKIVNALKKSVPEAAFITEEGTVEQNAKAEYHWIIDPLDGTTNFMHGFPLYAISVALTRNHIPVVGVVCNVVAGEMFVAVEDDYAYCNGTRINVSSVSGLNESLLATGFPYHQTGKAGAYLDIIKEFLEKTHGIRRLGSAAIDLAYVAAGRLEGFFEYNLHPWDVAAGILIIKQAGGQATDFNGGSNVLFGKELCASNGKIQHEMLTLIQRRWLQK
jgi:myo-inositol-1(or 4)-monophosphatase